MRIARNAKRQRVLVLALWLVDISSHKRVKPLIHDMSQKFT